MEKSSRIEEGREIAGSDGLVAACVLDRTVLASRDRRLRVEASIPRVYSVVGGGRRYLVGVLLVFFVLMFVLVVPAEEAPATVVLQARQAQEIIDGLRSELSVSEQVQVALVTYHPFVFAVEPVDRRRDRFRLSIEVGFLQLLSEGELRAALAHELGHVWIFTHHPFLQTERLANDVGQRVVNREDIEKLYVKLWSYEGTGGVALESLLGPRPEP